MPVDKSTEEWRNGSGAGATTYILHDFLLDGENREKAFTAEEVAEWVYENHADFPPVTLCRAYAEGNEEPLVGHVASLLARMDEHGRVTSRTVEQEGVREKRCYTSGFHTDRPSDVVKALEDLETKVGRLESKLERMDGTPEGGSAQFDQDTEDTNADIDELAQEIEDIEEDLEQLWTSMEVVDDRTETFWDCIEGLEKQSVVHNKSINENRKLGISNVADIIEVEGDLEDLNQKIEEIDVSLDSLWNNYEIIHDKTLTIQDMYGDYIGKLRQRIKDLEQQLQDEDEFNCFDPEEMEVE